MFFDGARTDGRTGRGRGERGWRVALATLAFERGVGLLGQQLGFQRELDHLIDLARRERRGGRPGDPPAPGRTPGSELEILRCNTPAER